MTMTNSAVNCPIHGTHGNLSNGLCWWCVKSGNIVAPPVRRINFSDSVTVRAPGTVRVIK